MISKSLKLFCAVPDEHEFLMDQIQRTERNALREYILRVEAARASSGGAPMPELVFIRTIRMFNDGHVELDITTKEK